MVQIEGSINQKPSILSPCAICRRIRLFLISAVVIVVLIILHPEGVQLLSGNTSLFAARAIFMVGAAGFSIKLVLSSGWRPIVKHRRRLCVMPPFRRCNRPRG